MARNTGLVIVNTVTLVIMLFVNYASNAGVFSAVNVGDISHKYDTLFAPAGYAFLIWSLIFLGCVAFVIYQWVLIKAGDPKNYIGRTGIWFSMSNILNTAWVFSWLNEKLALSVLLILLLLASLIIMTIKLRLELDDEPVRTILFVWWPVAGYLGWIMVATVACVGAWLVSLGWRGGSISEPAWTIIMIVVALILYFFLVRMRNLRESAGVGIWAFIAIAVRQWEAHHEIALTALIASALLLGLVLWQGFRNRDFAVFAKIKRGEWK